MRCRVRCASERPRGVTRDSDALSFPSSSRFCFRLAPSTTILREWRKVRALVLRERVKRVCKVRRKGRTTGQAAGALTRGCRQRVFSSATCPSLPGNLYTAQGRGPSRVTDTPVFTSPPWQYADLIQEDTFTAFSAALQPARAATYRPWRIQSSPALQEPQHRLPGPHSPAPWLPGWPSPSRGQSSASCSCLVVDFPIA